MYEQRNEQQHAQKAVTVEVVGKMTSTTFVYENVTGGFSPFAVCRDAWDDQIGMGFGQILHGGTDVVNCSLDDDIGVTNNAVVDKGPGIITHT